MEAAPRLTEAYVRLVFAWGHARLGRPESCETERSRAREILGELIERDPVHGLCHASFDARIAQALEGMPTGAALPSECAQRRETMGRFERYKADRLQQASRILDPSAELDPFQAYRSEDGRTRDVAFKEFSQLEGSDALADALDQTLHLAASTEGDRRPRLLAGSLDYLAALPASHAIPRLRRILELAGQVPVTEQPALLEDALLISGFFDRADLVAEVLAALVIPVRELGRDRPAEIAELLARGCPTLRRSGHASDAREMLHELAERVTGEELAAVRARLHIASAMAALGDRERVEAAFADGHAQLDGLRADERLELVREMALALGRTNPGQAIAGVAALMELLPQITDSFNTNTHFCLSIVHFMESCVLALASEDLSLGDWARHWVEEDEHLLHRRIHRDLTLR